MSGCLFMGFAHAVIYTVLVIYAGARQAIPQFHLKIVNRIWGIDKKLPVTHQDEEGEGEHHCFYDSVFSLNLSFYFDMGILKTSGMHLKLKELCQRWTKDSAICLNLSLHVWPSTSWLVIFLCCFLQNKSVGNLPHYMYIGMDICRALWVVSGCFIGTAQACALVNPCLLRVRCLEVLEA